MNRLLEDLLQTLKLIGDNWIETTTIINSPVAGANSAAHLIKLQGLGFVERVIIDDLSPFSMSKWRITKEGRAFIRLFEKGDNFQDTDGKVAAAKREQNTIVMTLPRGLVNTFLQDHPFVELTNEALTNMFQNAREEINIFSPYVDSSISFLMQVVEDNVKVRVITTPVIATNKKELPNAALERLSQSKNLQTRYIRSSLDGIQMYQTHAKMIMVDGKIAYIGSANIKETSIFYNLELGCLIKDQNVLKDLAEVFDDVFANYAVGREMLL
jgi:Phosphatidylserine/phosphatidylglycerophosphate/cardiolipin synthases and related enzymes